MDNNTIDKSNLLTADSLDQKWSFEIPPEPIPEEKITKTYSTDIVVVGAGLSGLCTACSALCAGAKNVMVVTASSIPVGRGGSNNGIGSKKQKELGFDNSPYANQHLVKVVQAMSSHNVDTDKWAKWINNSGESMDWMIDIMAAKGLKCGLEPGIDDPDNLITELASSHTFWNEEFPNGAVTGAKQQAKAYAATIEEMGGIIHYNTKGEQLVRENNNTGRVSALIAKDKDGNYVKYEAAKAIVLATGDFSLNKDMMAKYAPNIYRMYENVIDWERPVKYDAGFRFNGLYPGDGHLMGLWVGAAWQKTFPNAPLMHTDWRVPFPVRAGHSSFWGCTMNIYGKRFMNENVYISEMSNELYHVPEQKVFMIWDTDYAYTVDQWEEGTIIGCENGIMPKTPEEMIASWDEEYKDGWLFKGETVEEVLEQFKENGLRDTETAAKTIADWNRYCETGKDEEYQDNPKILFPIKKGPFYGAFLDGHAGGNMLVNILGGLRTNIDMQVCEEDDTPIEGLYNTGIMTGDFYANLYTLACFGQNLGALCCTLPYLLGKDLAKL